MRTPDLVTCLFGSQIAVGLFFFFFFAVVQAVVLVVEEEQQFPIRYPGTQRFTVLVGFARTGMIAGRAAAFARADLYR